MKSDALTRRFRAKGYAARARIEGAGLTLAFADLPPLLRVLLLQDGTVTKTLEAYFWEPVTIRAVDQFMGALGTAAKLPGCDLQQRVLHRRVEIVGDTTQRLFCLASSVVRTDHLPQAIAEKLVAGQIGIGELLRDRGLETYRELESIYLSVAPEIAANHLEQCAGAPSASVQGVPSAVAQLTATSPAAQPVTPPMTPALRVSRDYLIFLHHVPVIAITEHFPLDVFSNPLISF